MISLLKPLSLLTVILFFTIVHSPAFSATHCPVLVSEIKPGEPYGIILKDTQSRGLSGTVTKVDTNKCLVTVKYAEGKFAIVDGKYVMAILENP